jgi:hypothetical protein
MKPEGSLLYSQESISNPYPETDESSPHTPTESITSEKLTF